MENATKAYLISTGVLIAIIIFALVIYIYTQVSNYYQTQENNLTSDQMAEVNDQFSAYNREVSGFELVSLINKAIDFNQNKVYGASNTASEEQEKKHDGYQAMTIKIEVKNMPTGSLFNMKNGTITYTGKNSGGRKQLEQAIQEMQELESSINSIDINKLASNASDFERLNASQTKAKIKELTGKNYDKITKDQILKYADYLYFKRGTYSPSEKMGTNSVGQITSFSFAQK